MFDESFIKENVSRMFQGCFQSVSRKFQENFQGVSKKFHVTWHSSQLPEQKEGLFLERRVARNFFLQVSKVGDKNLAHKTKPLKFYFADFIFYDPK